MRYWPFLLAALLTNSAFADSPERHLFLDPDSIVESQGVELKVNPPARRDIVIRADRPWEKLMISFYLTVRDEGGKLRMWYICRDAKNRPNVAYAESQDGLHWDKPNLGIVEYEGSRDNNLVGLTSMEGAVYCDPRARSDAERYVYVTHVFGEGMVRYFSPDGLHWQRDAAALLRLGADSQAITFWDARTSSYALYLRAWEKRDDNKRYRTVVRADVPDLITPLTIGPSEKSVYLWGKDKAPVIGDEFPEIFATDDLDPPNSDVYTNSIEPYPLDPRWYVGFPSLFQRERSTSEGRLEVQFIGSLDGSRWQRYDRGAYASLGPAGSESSNMVFIGPGLIVRGDELWQYGTGFHSKHGDVQARKERTDGVIYRYVQRVDGFVSADFGARGGFLRTTPVRVSGNRLRLNVDTGAMGHLRIGLLSEDNKPLPGFEPEMCRVLRVNSTSAEVTWVGGADLSAWCGRELRVLATGARAKFFGFRFEDVKE